MISIIDLVKIASKNIDLSISVENYMTPNFQSIGINDDIKDVPQIMLNGNFRHLPVMENNKVVGIISMRDLILLGAPPQGLN